jgi:carbon-monoxide dehydrogenase medium subunit
VPGLTGIREDGAVVRVGAMTRQRALERWPLLAAKVPLLAAALPWVGHRETRNLGTVGGSLVHADPAAELLLVAATLGAELTVRGSDGERVVPAAELATGPFQTQVAPAELLTEIGFPVARGGDGFAFDEIARRHGDFALCGVAVALHREGDRVTSARVGLLGVGAVPEVHDVTDLLGPPAWEAAAAALVVRIEPSSDIHATAGYRRRLARVLIARCLERAWDDAGARTG